MVVTSSVLQQARDLAINYLVNNFTHIGVGTVNTTPSTSDTALGGEILRKTFEETTGPSSGVWTASMRISISEANGSTIKEVGLFSQSSGGTLASRNLTTEYVKTSDIEVWIDLTFTATAINK